MDRTRDGRTPLHEAAHNDNAETITLFIEAGADMEAKTKEGVTPLLEAAFWNGAEAITTLLQAGANGKARNSKGLTPYDLARDNSKLTGTDGTANAG